MKKYCRVSAAEFEVRAEDQEFYQSIGVPEPTLSPIQRLRRRLAFRNESKLYFRNCDGTEKRIVSMYAPQSPLPVYDNEYWWGDEWDALDYGREYDFDRPFFEQFQELLLSVPKMARIQQGEHENAKFCNCSANNKNCHLIFSASCNEDCLYATTLLRSKDCIDCFGVYDCELCYECIHSENCYSGRFLENCKNCSDSWFLRNCIGCQYCFGCVNLRNKSYHFFNEQLSKEDYFARLAEFDLGSLAKLNHFRSQYDEYVLAFPEPHCRAVNNENVCGDYIVNSKNAYRCFDVNHVEDCAYCDNLSNATNCYDVSFYGATGANELLYECEGVGHGAQRVLFSKLIWGGSSEVLYSYECFNSQHLFGCTGLKQAEYCVLNREYSPEQYKQLKEKIISRMRETGEWGEFFPAELSPFAYNESHVQEYFPLMEEKAIAEGLPWRHEEGYEVPSEAREVPDRLEDLEMQEGTAEFICSQTGKLFRIEQREVEFYKRLDLPAPTFHPDVRHLGRVRRRTARDLFDWECAQCGESILSSCRPDDGQQIVCEECYLKCVE